MTQLLCAEQKWRPLPLTSPVQDVGKLEAGFHGRVEERRIPSRAAKGLMEKKDLWMDWDERLQRSIRHYFLVKGLTAQKS